MFRLKTVRAGEFNYAQVPIEANSESTILSASEQGVSI